MQNATAVSNIVVMLKYFSQMFRAFNPNDSARPAYFSNDCGIFSHSLSGMVRENSDQGIFAGGTQPSDKITGHRPSAITSNNRMEETPTPRGQRTKRLLAHSSMKESRSFFIWSKSPSVCAFSVVFPTSMILPFCPSNPLIFCRIMAFLQLPAKEKSNSGERLKHSGSYSQMNPL